MSQELESVSAQRSENTIDAAWSHLSYFKIRQIDFDQSHEEHLLFNSYRQYMPIKVSFTARDETGLEVLLPASVISSNVRIIDYETSAELTDLSEDWVSTLDSRRGTEYIYDEAMIKVIAPRAVIEAQGPEISPEVEHSQHMCVRAPEPEPEPEPEPAAMAPLSLGYEKISIINEEGRVETFGVQIATFYVATKVGSGRNRRLAAQIKNTSNATPILFKTNTIGVDDPYGQGNAGKFNSSVTVHVRALNLASNNYGIESIEQGEFTPSITNQKLMRNNHYISCAVGSHAVSFLKFHDVPSLYADAGKYVNYEWMFGYYAEPGSLEYGYIFPWWLDGKHVHEYVPNPAVKNPRAGKAMVIGVAGKKHWQFSSPGGRPGDKRTSRFSLLDIYGNEHRLTVALLSGSFRQMSISKG